MLNKDLLPNIAMLQEKSKNSKDIKTKLEYEFANIVLGKFVDVVLLSAENGEEFAKLSLEDIKLIKTGEDNYQSVDCARVYTILYQFFDKETLFEADYSHNFYNSDNSQSYIVIRWDKDGVNYKQSKQEREVQLKAFLLHCENTTFSSVLNLLTIVDNNGKTYKRTNEPVAGGLVRKKFIQKNNNIKHVPANKIFIITDLLNENDKSLGFLYEDKNGNKRNYYLENYDKKYFIYYKPIN